MRSPTSGCWRMNAHSSASSGPALPRIASGDRGLADIVQLGGERDPAQLGLGHPHPLGGLLGARVDAAEMLAQLELALADHREEHVRALPARGRPARLVLVHALVGE